VGKINYGRVVLGGIVAGVVFVLTDMLGMYILPFDWEAWVRERGLTVPPFALWIVLDILMGILVVWLYAAIRPRFGPGVKTAVIGAVWVWLLLAIMYFGFTAIGLFEMGSFWLMGAWGLVQVIAATVAGAWLYKEEAGAM
jgi:hypothetical protein